MFSGCLGALDIDCIDDVVDHEYEYDTLPRVRYSHTWKIKKYWWPTVTISRFRAHFLINPHDQVNTSLRQKVKALRYPSILKLTKKKKTLSAKKLRNFQARGRFRATKEEKQARVLEKQAHFWGTQFFEMPYGVAGTAGAGVVNIFKERSNQAGCFAC